MKKKFIISTLCLLLIFNITSYAWMSKQDLDGTSVKVDTSLDVLYDDFTNDKEGGIPFGYEVSANGSKVYIEDTKINDKESKNCVCLYDTVNNGSTDFSGPQITKRFNKVEGTFGLEYRFKTSKTKTKVVPLSVEIKAGSNKAYRVILPSDQGSLCFNNGQNVAIMDNRVLPYDTWFTIKTIFDIQNGKVDFMVQSDYLKTYDGKVSAKAVFDKKKGTIKITDMIPIDSFTDNYVDNVTFAMSRWEGKCYIDYIKVQKDVQRMEGSGKDTGIKAPVVPDPKNKPSGRYINIYFNNEYKFLSKKPILKEGRTFIYLDNLCEILNIKKEVTDNGFKLKDDKTTMEIKGKDLYINGKKYEGSTEFIYKDNSLFVPVRFIAENFSYKVGFFEETNTVTIEKEAK